MENKKTTFEKIKNSFFSPEGKAIVLSSKEEEIKRRWWAGFSKWLDEPALTNRAIVLFLMNAFNIEKSQAYEDINAIELLLGNVPNAYKERQRYTSISMIKEGYEIVRTAKTMLDVKRGLAMIRAGEALGKVTRLDKKEAEPIPYDEIVPQSFEPTGDISVLGIKPIENLKKRQEKLRLKYGANIEDAEIME